MEIIDISRRFFSCEVYPGDPKPEAEQIAEIGKDSECNLTAVHACVHTGTHADAPLHFIPDGMPIDEMTLEPYIGPCTVIEVPGGVITGEYVDEHFPKECRRLLVKGGGTAYFMDSSAQELTERFVRGDSSRHTEGSGLGLSITKILAELQDASLEVEVDDSQKFTAKLLFDVAVEEKTVSKKKKNRSSEGK